MTLSVHVACAENNGSSGDDTGHEYCRNDYNDDIHKIGSSLVGLAQSAIFSEEKYDEDYDKGHDEIVNTTILVLP